MNKSANCVRIVLLTAALLGAASCTEVEDVALDQTEQDVLSTDLTAYTSGQSIVVNYDGMQGTSTDYIVVAHPSDPANVYELALMTNGTSSGSMTFDSTQLGAGTYEARAFYNSYGTQNFVIQQTSPSFTITGGPSLMASQTSYGPGSTVVINYSGLTTSTTNWIAIYRPGDPDGSYISAQVFTPAGSSMGQATFAGLAAGTYEARYHHYGSGSVATYAYSPTFTITAVPPNPTTITTQYPIYGTSQKVKVTYTNMPATPPGAVAIAQAGAAAGVDVQRVNLNAGQVSGNRNFSPPTAGWPAGNYEARAYSSTNTILAFHSFTVSGAKVDVTATSYPSGAQVTVTFGGRPPGGYLAISFAGSADNSTVQTFTPNGNNAQGNQNFSSLADGGYEARIFNSAGVLQGRSEIFTVGAASCTVPAVSPVLAGVISGDLTLDSATQELTAVVSVSLTSSILFTSVREREPSPRYGATLCELVAAGVHCKRDQAGTDTGSGTIIVHYTIVTFTSGVAVQRGLVNTNLGNPATVALTPVDTGSSFVLLGGSVITGSGWGSNEFTRAELLSPSSLQIRHSTMGSQVAWQVVTMVGAVVTRGTTSLAAADTARTVSIPLAPLSSSLLLASYTTDVNSAAAASLMLQSSIDTPTALSFQRSLGGPNLDVSWELVALPFSTRHGNTPIGVGVISTTVSISGIAAATSVALSSTQSVLGQSCGSSMYNGPDLDLVGESAFTMTTGDNILRLARQSSVAAATIPWTVIDFARNCFGN